MFTIVVQAGGESSRMGQDKALLPFLGRPLIARVLERVAPLGDEVLLTTNQPQDYRFLNLPLFPDIIPDRGALGGVYTALHSARGDLVALVACDMPFANPKLLAYQLETLVEGGYDAVIPKEEGGTEPFHAVYRRETCLPAVRAAIQADKWRVDSWFAQVKIHFLSAEEIRPYDPNGLAFVNVNDPQEFRQAEALALKET
jgi:molybdopterin-guanine dinucleotide biosynthesis protein A